MVAFDQFVVRFADVLKAKGFKKDGLYFRLKAHDNNALINIQKSMGSTSSAVKLTLNVGVHYKSLFLFDTGETKKKPIVSDCQWKMRIGDLLSVKKDYWWVIDMQSDWQKIAEEQIEIFNTIIYPAIVAIISDELFIKYLETGNVNGTTYSARLVYLSSFYCMRNDIRLPAILAELKDYCDKNRLRELYEWRLEIIGNWKKINGNI